MRTSAIILAFGALYTASAHPQQLDPRDSIPYGTFQAAQPGDSRGPCPMLNVLANHGYLPRNGRNIDKATTRTAMKDGLNLENDFADIMFDPGLLTSPKPDSFSFDLDNLNRHNLLEHDGSLSRADAYWNIDQTFNTTVYNESLSYLGRNGDTIDCAAAAAARMARMATSQATNPTFFVNASAATISFGETGAYILALGDKVAGTVPLARVRMMFEQEKLPHELGWTTPKTSATADDLFNLTGRVIAAANISTSQRLRLRAEGGIHAGVLDKWMETAIARRSI
ncbi:Cloroperoxidase [Myriangium duriaei CBS 260.36]|uniref:Cloroperoxidase n=1 Tax=Myriangium duriaei CBS 260.36 TaxID=1168546 RepID=A0A9P4MR90_9PEZI|nr:Cloroperoxidase [Myriangium duriaei CBS 260.36]